MADVTIMVTPNIEPDENNQARPAKNQFLLELKSGWREVVESADMLPAAQLGLYRAQVDQDLKDLMALLANSAGGGGAPANLRANLEDLGTRWWNKLLPEGLQAILQKNAGNDPPSIFRIYCGEKVDWMPWEVMHDGTDFLGVRYQIARVPIAPSGPDLRGGKPRKVRRIFSMLGTEVLENPEIPDWAVTFKVAQNRPAVSVRTWPKLANGDWDGYADTGELRKAIKDEHFDPDILHITCHGGVVDKHVAPSVGPFLGLKRPYNQGTNRIDSEAVRNWGRDLGFGVSRPLVFANACGSTADVGELISPWSIGQAFFARSAVDFIGTFAPISKTMALPFAQKFYECLLGNDPQPVGLALYRAKRSFHDDNGAKDPSYLFYCLYGPPETRFELAV